MAGLKFYVFEGADKSQMPYYPYRGAKYCSIKLRRREAQRPKQWEDFIQCRFQGLFLKRPG